MFLESYGGTTNASGDCYHFGSRGPSGIFLRLDAEEPCLVSIPSACFCYGPDGATAACPCGAGGLFSGCDSPIPAMQGGGLTGGVQLDFVAQSFGAMNRATLVTSGYPNGSSPGTVLFRNNGLDPFSPVVFGDGVRCVDGAGVVRLGGAIAIAGTATHTFAHGTMVGSGTFFYQAWYRSLPASYCDAASGFNLSNGVTLDW